MSNTLLTIDMITKDAIPLFVNSNAFLMNIDRQYSSEFKADGAKIGETLRIRLPSDYTVTTGPALAVQGNVQVNTALTVSTQKHVDIAFTSVEQRMQLGEFRELVLRPAINNLAGAIAADVATLAETVPNFVANFGGTSGAMIAPTKTQYLQSNAVLTLNSAPTGGRVAVTDPETNATLVDTMSGLFNPTGRISQQFDDGRMMGPALGIGKWMEDQTILSHTAGTFTAGTVTSVGTGGNSLGVSGGITGTLAEGDIITVSGVYAVNRVTKQAQTFLRTFVVTAACASGATSVPIYPALIGPSGGNPVQFQTVAQLPAGGATISLATAPSAVYKKNLVMRPEAFTLGMCDLPMYGAGVIACSRESYQGCSLRILDAYLPGSDQKVTRIDALYGYGALRPEWACVVADNQSVLL